jgi:hypothetical protein
MPNRDRLLELALMGLEADRTRIDSEIAQIKSQLTGSATTEHTMSTRPICGATGQKS